MKRVPLRRGKPLERKPFGHKNYVVPAERLLEPAVYKKRPAPEPVWVPRARELRAEGMTYKQIATELSEHGINENNVNYRLNIEKWATPPTVAKRRGTVRPCVVCGTEFYSTPSEAKANQRFCSRACWYKQPTKRSAEATSRLAAKFSAERKGRNNPNFRHGKRLGDRHLMKVFNVAAKGETHCRACGSSEKLHLHHAIPRAHGSKESRLNLLNGIALCSSCHTRWHRGSLTIHRDVFSAEEWGYLLSVEMPGRITSAWLDDHYPPVPTQ